MADMTAFSIRVDEGLAKRIEAWRAKKTVEMRFTVTRQDAIVALLGQALDASEKNGR